MKWILVWVFVWMFHQHVICTTLYRGKNRDDALETVWNGRCTNLSVAKYLVGSIDTKGGCIQLYDQENCQGNSVEVGPKFIEFNHLQKLGFENRAVSVGPCTTTVDVFSQSAYRGLGRRSQLDDDFESEKERSQGSSAVDRSEKERLLRPSAAARLEEERLLRSSAVDISAKEKSRGSSVVGRSEKERLLRSSAVDRSMKERSRGSSAVDRSMKERSRGSSVVGRSARTIKEDDDFGFLSSI